MPHAVAFSCRALPCPDAERPAGSLLSGLLHNAAHETRRFVDGRPRLAAILLLALAWLIAPACLRATVNAATPAGSVKQKRPLAEDKLAPLFQGESLSALLPPEDDGLRAGDPSTDYFVIDRSSGNLLPQARHGRQWLSTHGFTFDVIYKAEGMANIAGGVSKGMDYVHDLRVTMLFDLGKLLGLDGWYVHGLIMNREGRQVGWDHVGERNVLLTELWSIHGPAAARLADLYAEKSFLGDRLNINIGRIALTHTYATSALLCTFMMQCSAPMAIRSPAGWSVYPKTSWGGTLRFRPLRDLTLRTGIYKIAPKVEDNTGWAWASETTTGIQTPVELTWEPFFGPHKLVGHYKFGYGHDTSRYPDLIGTIPAADRAIIHAHPDKPLDTFYVEADQMIYRTHGANQMSGGYLLAGYIHNTPSVSTFADEFYFGASLVGLLPGRPRDRLGVMYSYYQMSPRLADGQRLLQAAGLKLPPYVTGPQTHSAVLEAYYSVPVLPGLILYPEFEYMMRPGETSVIPNAALVGIKMIANL